MAALQREQKKRISGGGVVKLSAKGGGGEILLLGGALIATALGAAFAFRRSRADKRRPSPATASPPPPPPPLPLPEAVQAEEVRDKEIISDGTIPPRGEERGGDAKRGLRSLIDLIQEEDVSFHDSAKEMSVQKIEQTPSLEDIEIIEETEYESIESGAAECETKIAEETGGTIDYCATQNETTKIVEETGDAIDYVTNIIEETGGGIDSVTTQFETKPASDELEFAGEEGEENHCEEEVQSMEEEETESPIDEESDATGSSSLESGTEAIWPADLIEKNEKSTIIKPQENVEHLRNFLATVGSMAITSTKEVDSNPIQAHSKAFVMLLALLLVLGFLSLVVL